MRWGEGVREREGEGRGSEMGRGCKRERRGGKGE